MTTKLPTISHSKIVAYRECQQRYDYRYRQKLVSKRAERPLYMGNWIHRCLETHYDPAIKDWTVGHKEYVKLYNKLFEEEQQRLDKGKSRSKGPWEPLPSQVKRIMESYLWYHRAESAETLAVEVDFEYEVQDEDGLHYLLNGRIDRVKRDEDGLVWIEDHKVWTEVPDANAFQTMDPQLTIYLRAAKEALGVEAAGVEYNYIKSTAPTIPTLRKDGQPSEAAVDTDYPTLYRFLTKNGLDAGQYRDLLTPLAAASPFLRRYRSPRNELVTDRILADASRTAREIMGGAAPVRNITRNCERCPYQSLCRTELFGLDSSYIRANDFTIEGTRPRRASAA